MDELKAELQNFIGLPDVPAGFVADCAAAIDAAEGASAQLRVADEEVVAAAAALDAVSVDEALVERAPEIIELFSHKGDYVSKRQDLPRIEAERDDINETLSAAAHRLGLRDAEEVVARLPSDATLAGATALIATGQKLETAIAADEVRLAQELASIETQEAEASGASLSDPKPWRDQYAALAPDLKQLADQGYLETSHRNTLQKLRDTGLRMTPQGRRYRRAGRGAAAVARHHRRPQDDVRAHHGRTAGRDDQARGQRPPGAGDRAEIAGDRAERPSGV